MLHPVPIAPKQSLFLSQSPLLVNFHLPLHPIAIAALLLSASGRGDPEHLKFIYKKLCIYSYTFKLQ